MFRWGLVVITTVLAAGSALADSDGAGGSYRGDRPSIAGGNGLPSYLSGVGTYVGGIAASRFPYNGNYFSVDDGNALQGRAPTDNVAGPRIIRVNKRHLNANCSYEAGVCVIRP